MRVVVVGATGNVGTSLVHLLSGDGGVDSVLGVARRPPELALAKVEWTAADIAQDDLAPLFRGADCVVHLAWAIQPSHDPDRLTATNVHGSTRLFEAVAAAGVPALVYASSVGTYAPGPKEQRVDESWPATGIPTSIYSRHKAEVERRLDRFEAAHPEIRCVRLRPGLIFKRGSATEQRRLFAGPFLPTPLLRPGVLPVVPVTRRLVFQAVHTRDAADAYRRAILDGDARGAFNVAAEPVITPRLLAELLNALPLPVPPQALRQAARWSWRLHLQPSSIGWVDMALGVPVMDTTRVRSELGWRATRSSLDALREVLDGMRERAGEPTPPLEPRSRLEELATAVGGRELLRR